MQIGYRPARAFVAIHVGINDHSAIPAAHDQARHNRYGRGGRHITVAFRSNQSIRWLGWRKVNRGPAAVVIPTAVWPGREIPKFALFERQLKGWLCDIGGNKWFNCLPKRIAKHRHVGREEASQGNLILPGSAGNILAEEILERHRA